LITINYIKIDNHPRVLATYQKLAYNLAKSLKTLSESIENGEKYIAKHNLVSDLHDLELAITNYENDLGKDNASGVLMLTNMLHYAEKQVEINKTLERALQPLSNYKT
jgi:hypothetical protein